MLDLEILASGVMNVFTEGTYPIRALLFAVFAALLFVAWKKLPLKHASMYRWVASAAVALFVLSLGTQLFLYESNAIPEHVLVTAFSGGEITNTRLTHTHVGKSGIATLLTPFTDIKSQADTGRGLSVWLPEVLGPIFAILLVVAGIFTLLASASRIKEEQGSVAQWALYLSLSLVGFIALTKSVDGGLLSDGACIALIAFIALLYVPARIFLRVFAMGAIAYTALFALLYVSGFYWGHGYALEVYIKASVLSVVLVALHILRTHGVRKARTMLGIALLLVLLVAGTDVYEKYLYIGRVIEPGQSFIRLSDGSYISADAYSGETVRDVLEGEKVSYWYQPVSLYGEACAATTKRYRARFTLRTTDEPSVLELATKDGSMLLVPDGDRYQAELFLHPCIPASLQSVPQLLGQMGIDTALIYGYESRIVPLSDVGIKEVRN